MPIVFEQPDPVGKFPELASAGGYVNQYNQDRQFMLQAASIAAQSQNAARASSAATNEGNANRSTQAAEASARLQPSGRDIFAANQQAQAQQAQASQQQQLLQQRSGQQMEEFTYADNLRMQRLQQQLSAVEGDDTLEPEEKAAYKLQLQTGIDPLKQRQEATKQQMYQQQMEQAQEQAKVHAVNAKTFQDFVAAGKPPIQKIPGGGMLVYQPDGKVQYHKPEQQDEGDPFDALAGGGADAAGGASKSRGTATHADDYWKNIHEITKALTTKTAEGGDKTPTSEEVLKRHEELMAGQERMKAKAELEHAARYTVAMESAYPSLDAAAQQGQITPTQAAKYRQYKTMLNSAKARPTATVPGEEHAGTAPAGVSTDAKGNASTGDEPWLNGQLLYKGKDGKTWIKGSDEKLYMQDKDGKVYLAPPGTPFGEATEGASFNMQGLKDVGDWLGKKARSINFSPRGPGVP